ICDIWLKNGLAAFKIESEKIPPGRFKTKKAHTLQLAYKKVDFFVFLIGGVDQNGGEFVRWSKMFIISKMEGIYQRTPQSN
ncbi:MAG: hypothetical protein ABF875_07430, partial [Liquorilactobacillus nagelii]